MRRVGTVCLLLAVGGCAPAASAHGLTPPGFGGPSFDAGPFFLDAGRLDAGTDAAAPCMPDMFEPDDSYANGQVAGLPYAIADQTVSFTQLGIDRPDDVDWYQVDFAAAVGGAMTSTVPVYVDLTGIGDGDDYDLSVWESCAANDETVLTSSCLEGDDEVPLPERVDGGVVTGPPGCRSAHPGNVDEHAAETASCARAIASAPQIMSPGKAWIRVQPTRWSGACSPYSLAVTVCAPGPEGAADTPADAYDITPFINGPVPSRWLELAFEAPGDADWLVLDDPNPALPAVSGFTELEMSADSPAPNFIVQLFFVCDDGSGDITCADTSDVLAPRDLGDGLGTHAGCRTTPDRVGPVGTRVTVSCGGGPIAGRLYAYVTSDLARACAPYGLTFDLSRGTPAGDGGTPAGDGGAITDGGATDGGASSDGG